MSEKKTSIILVLFFMFLTLCSSQNHKRNKKNYKPCKTLVFYFHDILYNGHNAANATSVIVGEPQWGDKTTLTKPFHHGNVVVFDDPITLDSYIDSTPVGRAQGQYFYTTKNTFTAWFGFSFVFNSKDYNGTINFIGANPITVKTRDISVVGGTGDFFMHRGIASLMTGAYEGDSYFSLRVDIKFYECW